jgi:thiamine-monophosphate kinase
MTEKLADIGEFGLIHRIDVLLKQEGFQAEGVTLRIGDDTAAIQPREGFELLITCDCLVAGRHFLPGLIKPRDLGRRAMTVNISDIGAMGGIPRYALVSLGLKSDMPVAEIEDIYRGFVFELNPFGAEVIGGNITKVEQDIFIDITVIGEVENGKTVRRSGARPGDMILVTGYPGQAAAGLDMLRKTTSDESLYSHPLVQAYVSPPHRAWEGQKIASSGLATAMIDISDGLLADLAHICSESGVGADLETNKIPVSKPLKKISEQENIQPHLLCSKESDDYELILTCPPHEVERIKEAVGQVSDVKVSDIGIITPERGRMRWIFFDGLRQDITPKGWDHFSKRGENK